MGGGRNNHKGTIGAAMSQRSIDYPTNVEELRDVSLTLIIRSISDPYLLFGALYGPLSQP